MRVLAFDTTMAALSVAVHESGQGIVSSLREEMETGQAERLLPAIDQCLRSAGLPLSQIDRLIVTRGPGTFTGIRIGLAVARGLRLSAGLPVVAISSLSAIAAALAHRHPPAGSGFKPQRLIVALTARGNGAFLGLFDHGGAPLADPRQQAAHEFVSSLDRPFSYLVVGSAAHSVAAAALDSGLEISIGPAAAATPEAADFAHLAESLPPSPELLPLYLREPDAKPQPPAAPTGGTAL